MPYAIRLDYIPDAEGGQASASLTRLDRRQKNFLSIVQGDNTEGEFEISIAIDLEDGGLQRELKQFHGLFWDYSGAPICMVVERLLEEAFLAGIEFERQKNK